MENEGREQMTILPALAMRGIVMFPSMTLHFDVGREQSIHAIREAMSQDKRIFLAAQKDFTVESPQNDDIYTVGVVARIVQLLNNGKELRFSDTRRFGRFWFFVGSLSNVGVRAERE